MCCPQNHNEKDFIRSSRTFSSAADRSIAEFLSRKGRILLVILFFVNLLSEYFIVSYPASWIFEWSDYWSYWGHYCVYINLAQLIFPNEFTKIPLIGNMDWFKINTFMLTNTTFMWQLPRIHRYFDKAFYCEEFFINSMLHGGNWLLLVLYRKVSGIEFSPFSFKEMLFLPGLYSSYIFLRVSFFGSVMKYYLPEGWGTPKNTLIVGLMWITLQALQELVMWPLFRYIKQIPGKISKIFTKTSEIHVSKEKVKSFEWRNTTLPEILHMLLQIEEGTFFTPLATKLATFVGLKKEEKTKVKEL